MLQEKMILALKRNETSTRNPRRHLSPRIERYSRIASDVHDERRRSHFAKKLSHIEFSHCIVITGSAFRRGGSALQFIEEVDLVLCRLWHKLSGEQLPESRVVRGPTVTH